MIGPLGSAALNFGRGAIFMGASKGATGVGKALNVAGKAVPLAGTAAGSFSATSQQPGFKPQSTIKTSAGSLRELIDNPPEVGMSPGRRAAIGLGAALAGYGVYRAAKATEKKADVHPLMARLALAKFGSGAGWHRPVNALSYGAFALPYLSETVHDNPKLTAALNAAGLIGLGVTSADSVRHGDPMAAYDVAGLGVMGAGMIHGALRRP